MKQEPLAVHDAAFGAARSATPMRAWVLGGLGVALFAFSLPATRMAVGTPAMPELAPLFVAMARAVVAGLLAAAWLFWRGAALPSRRLWPAIAGVAAGVVFGFPVLTSLALRQVDAVHASLMLGLLPLTTAAIGALLARQRPSKAFWFWAAAGSVLVCAYALRQAHVVQPGMHGLRLQPADILLIAAMLAGGWGYAQGARLAGSLPAEQVISWAVVCSLPLTLPATLWLWPQHAVAASAWGALAYLGVISMWLGFFAWYRALALGGTVRISQIQLLQPFLSMLAAAALLGEHLDGATLLFAAAVMATVLAGRRARVHPAPAPTTPGSTPEESPR
ncbi:MAG: EamA family transporter [Thiomonas sp. 13-66-29]|uniref:DMT family transporter n=1 Tax=Thiomonas sp. TaxID=2047785 RepID=UPI000BCC349D|nr:MAG: EamA family transporter [Thiomonas sp. 15-66-11]OZB63947.1 MAG: EamA family transporter [Thiomonas sp. 13-66-29]